MKLPGSAWVFYSWKRGKATERLGMRFESEQTQTALSILAHRLKADGNWKEAHDLQTPHMQAPIGTLHFLTRRQTGLLEEVTYGIPTPNNQLLADYQHQLPPKAAAEFEKRFAHRYVGNNELAYRINR